MTTPDSSKTGTRPGDIPVLTRVRAAALAELRAQSRGLSWRRQAAGVAVLVLATTALVIEIGSLVSIIDPDRLARRALPVGLLVILQVVGVFLAIAPGRRLARFGAVILAAAAAAAVVAWRGSDAASLAAGTLGPTSAFACSLSHLAVDIVPLTIVLYALRRFAWTLGRAALAGAAAGATGAIAGELACSRGWGHVLVHHVGTALLITLLGVLISRARTPDSFAP
jgi:hypothetical protein